MAMQIDEATRSYEHWLSTYMPLIPADLALKHAAMRRDAFSFLRGAWCGA